MIDQAEAPGTRALCLEDEGGASWQQEQGFSKKVQVGLDLSLRGICLEMPIWTLV